MLPEFTNRLRCAASSGENLTDICISFRKERRVAVVPIHSQVSIHLTVEDDGGPAVPKDAGEPVLATELRHDTT